MAKEFPHNLLNLTPHDVVIYVGDGQSMRTVVIPASGFVARLQEKQPAVIETRDGIPVVKRPVYGAIEFVTPQGGIAEIGRMDRIIVGALVAEQMVLRKTFKEVYSPDTSKWGAVREDGRIVGTKSLRWWC